MRILYPVAGSNEQVIDVLGDGGTTTEANAMNLQRELQAPDDPPPYSATGGRQRKNKATKKHKLGQRLGKVTRTDKGTRKHKGSIFSKDEFIAF